MTFINYRASAGSGKTYRLVLEYLSLALQYDDKFRHILAITFTNKAAAEMKERILRSLKELSKGENPELKKNLLEKNPYLKNIEAQAAKVLKRILHNYSHFAVTTIDSFINRLVRSFTYETDIPAGFDIELNFNRMNNYITGGILSDIGTDPDTNHLILNFVMDKIGSGKSWNVASHITTLLREFYVEKTQAHLENLSEPGPSGFLKAAEDLKRIIFSYTGSMKEFGVTGLKMIKDHGFSVKSFPWGATGAAGHFIKLASLKPFSVEDSKPGSRFSEGTWEVKGSSDELKAALAGDFGEQLRSLHSAILSFYHARYGPALTAKLIHENVFLLGLIGKIRTYLKEYKSEYNVVPIFDLTKNVHQLISDGDIPFIYYMLGDSFEHIMIDEFQDTSRMQWDSLFPLIENSVAEKKINMGVGDLKQSIYRWRGGETDIMEKEIHRQFGSRDGVQVINLENNYRSRRNIVEFNNRLFDLISGDRNPNPILPAIYRDAPQKVMGGDGGFVSVTFTEPGTDASRIPEMITGMVKNCIDSGFDPGEIAVISRRRETGMSIAKQLIRSGYAVISPELLELKKSPVSVFLVNLLRLILDNTSKPVMADLLFFLSEHFSGNIWDAERTETYFSDPDAVTLPACFREFLDSVNLLVRLPLYEAVEELVRIFALNRSLKSESGGYLVAFLNMINEYSHKQGGSISGFFSWWEENGDDHSVPMPENSNGITLMTIHKAKGLEFPVVIIPDTDWPNISDNVWLNTDNGGTVTDHYLPPYLISRKKELTNSLLSNSYSEEMFRRELDDLNLFYVACTRAKDALIVLSSGNEPEGDEHSNGKMLRDIAASDYFDTVSENRFEKGERGNPGTEGVKDHCISINDGEIISERWSEKITIRERSEKFWDIIPEVQLKKIDRGILVHEILSQISADRDVETILRQMAASGRADEAEIRNIREEIEALLRSPEVREWFFGEGEHLIEQPLLTTDGLFRPDRVIVSGDRVTVIDFKTGRESENDIRQVKGYKTLLEKMGYKNVRSILYYLATGTVKEI